MAVKTNWNNQKQVSWDDVFDTQEALDAGILGSVTSGYQTDITSNTGFFGVGASRNETTKGYQANAGDFGSMLDIDGMSAATGIAANKERKLEQKKTKAQGKGVSQSILGGTVV